MSQRKGNITAGGSYKPNSELVSKPVSSRKTKKPAKPRVDRTPNAHFGRGRGYQRQGAITIGLDHVTYNFDTWSQARNVRKLLRRVLPALVSAVETRPRASNYGERHYAELMTAWRKRYTVVRDDFDALIERVPREISDYVMEHPAYSFAINHHMLVEE